MAWAIATRKAEGGGRPRFVPGGSRLGKSLIALNLAGLVILVGGSLVLNELRQGLIETRLESLSSSAELLAEVIAEGATRGDPEPVLEPIAALVLARFVPSGQRARLYDENGLLVADSYVVSEDVEVRELPPARRPDEPARGEDLETKTERAAKARAALRAEVEQALRGQTVSGLRVTEDGGQVVSVSIPVQRVQAVLGVLTLEAGDVDKIVWAQRVALMPFAVVALLVTLLSSILLHRLVAQPILRLAAAADQVRTNRARAISLPDLESRQDEIGNLTRALESMTDTLSTRMDAIERFAADVSHEIKNPLTSIRSAVETLDYVKDEKGKARLTEVLKADVRRLDRLITDISNASRLDAEMSRDTPRPIELDRLLAEIVQVYEGGRREGEAAVRLIAPEAGDWRVMGREGPLGQVVRNLVDNARSFSPAGGEVRLSLHRDGADALRPVRLVVDDDGPGIPPENLETVFQRFYTSRPKGAAFGGNSGLGLSIARQIVETDGGRVWAENRLDSEARTMGARFVVALAGVRS